MSELELPVELHEAIEAARPVQAGAADAERVAAVAQAQAALGSLQPVRAPAWLASSIARRISSEAAGSEAVSGDRNGLEARLAAVPRVSAPASLALRVSQRIAADALAKDPSFAPLENLARVSAPPEFARRVAALIASDAHLAAVEESRASNLSGVFYLVAALVGAGTLAACVWAWPYARTAGLAFASAVSTVSPTLVATYLAFALLALVAASGRVRPRLGATIVAFVIGAVLVTPQMLPYFGSGRVAAGEQVGTVVRVGGDLTVAGTVHGDAINLGGSIRLEPGGKVDGMVVTLLGDVNAARGSRTSGTVSAVLGAVQAEGSNKARPQWLDLPRTGAASALQPVRDLFQTRYWPVVYAAMLAALGALVCTLPRWQEAVLAGVPRDGTRALGLGLSLLLVGLPVVALAALSVVAAPLALVVLVVGVLAYSLGASLTLVTATGAVLRRLRLPDSPGIRVGVGFALFVATLLLPPLAVAAWALAGAWGAGMLLMALLSGRLALGSQQLADA